MKTNTKSRNEKNYAAKNKLNHHLWWQAYNFICDVSLNFLKKKQLEEIIKYFSFKKKRVWIFFHKYNHFSWMKFTKQTFSPYIFLAAYHFFSTTLAYNYIQKNGGDATLYWFQNNSNLTQGKTWLDFFNYGTDVILFINYPFAKLLQLPMWLGFVLYSTIGFIGILQFKKLAELWLDKKIVFFGINVLPLLFFMPNLHFWTANLGKEAVCFLCVSTIFLQLYRKRIRSWQLLLSILFLIVIRPHVALMLIFSAGLIYSVFNTWSNWRCITFISSGLLGWRLVFTTLKSENLKLGAP